MYSRCNEICVDACQSIIVLLNSLNESVNQMIASENLSDSQENKACFYENLRRLSDADELIQAFQKDAARVFINTEIVAERIIIDSKEAM